MAGPIYMDQSQIEKLFSEQSNSSEMLDYNGFVSLFESLTGAKSSKNYGIFFLIADSDLKGYLTKKDWLEFMKSFCESNSQFKMVWKFFSKLSGNGDSKELKIKELNTVLHDLDAFIESDSKDPTHVNWAKINDLIHSNYLQKTPSGTIKYHDLNNLIINELNSEKIERFYQANSGSVTYPKVKQLVDDMYSHKIDKQFLDFVMGCKPQVSYSLNDIKFVTNLLSKYYVIAKLTDDFKSSPVEKFSDYLVESNKTNVFTEYEIDTVNKYIQSNEKPQITLENDSFSSSKPIKEAVEKAAEKSGLYHTMKSIYHFGLGAISGAIGATMVYPIDLVKTRMQAQSNGSVKAYKNSLHCFTTIIAKEGPSKLYSGLVPQLVGVAPEKAIKLFMNDLVRTLASDKSGTITLPFEILAGASAGCAQVICTNPLEIVKIRLQIQGQLIGKLNAAGNVIAKRSAADVIKELGLRGLYKGSSACLLRDVPFSAIYFPAYAHLKQGIIRRNKRSDPNASISTLQLLTAGAVAGMPAAFLTTPCDVIKTRLQMERKQGDIVYNNIADAAKKIYKREGLSAFFKGGAARVLRSSPQFGFTLASYELLQQVASFDSVSKGFSSSFSGMKIKNESPFNSFSSSTLNSDLTDLGASDFSRKLSCKTVQTLDLFRDMSPSFNKFDDKVYERFKNAYGG